MQNKMTKANGKGVVWVIISLAIIAGAFLFFTGYFNVDKKEGEIVIDDDNTEIVSEKRDLKEISDRLDELDIDLDDILNELEF